MIEPMKEKIRKKLFQQRKLLNNSPAEFRESSYVFPASEGGLRRLGSLKRCFSQLRESADISKSLGRIYCLRNTIASMMLSDGATLAEVAYQLGHAPGSPITRRYAK